MGAARGNAAYLGDQANWHFQAAATPNRMDLLLQCNHDRLLPNYHLHQHHNIVEMQMNRMPPVPPIMPIVMPCVP